MTVAQLIRILKTMEQNRVVVMSSDAEGNSYAPLRGVELGAYKDGEVGLEELTPQLSKQGYSEEDVMSGGRKAAVLWP